MKKQTIKIKSVIFDMDGVITNTMPDHFKAWKVTLAKYNLTAKHIDIYSREGQPGTAFVFEIFEQYGIHVSNAQAIKILKEKEEYFKTIVKTRWIQGSRTLLKNLVRSHIKIALVTGTARHELHKILPDSIYNLFSVIITGTDVKHGKPHPEPYLKALKKLSIKPHEAVVIENAPFGITSAQRAGMKCLALETSLPPSYLHEADKIFPSIKELNKKIIFKYKE